MKAHSRMKRNRTLEQLMFTKQNESKKIRIKVLGRAEALESKNMITQSFPELLSVSLRNVIIYFQAFRKKVYLMNTARTARTGQLLF